MIMLSVTLVALMVVMILILIRAVLGPSIFDRVLAVNQFGTKTVLLIAVLGFLLETPVYLLDIAILYALINFISIIGILHYFEYNKADQEEEPR